MRIEDRQKMRVVVEKSREKRPTRPTLSDG